MKVVDTRHGSQTFLNFKFRSADSTFVLALTTRFGVFEMCEILPSWFGDVYLLDFSLHREHRGRGGGGRRIDGLQ